MANEASGARCQEGPQDRSLTHFLSSCDTHLEVDGDGSDEHPYLFSFSADVNECSYGELNTCSGRELCLNVEGSHQCVGYLKSPGSSPPGLDGTCAGEQLGFPGGEEGP